MRLAGEGNFHLSTLMYPAHRRAKLEEIRRRLREGLPCRVISTSLIEAGVDVDFPAVFREEAGLDSILQAAGRCNREGKRPVSERSIVTVFRGEGRTPPPLLPDRRRRGPGWCWRSMTTSPLREADPGLLHIRLLELERSGSAGRAADSRLNDSQSELFPFQSRWRSGSI